MSSTVNSDSNTSTVPIYVVQPIQTSNTTGQSVNSQPVIVPESGYQQASPVMYQVAYQSGAQPLLVPVAYTPQTYGPVNPMPDEITDDLVYILSMKSCMVTLLVLNFVLSLFILEDNLITNIIGAIYFCEYSGWMMIIYAVGNGFSVLLSLYYSITLFASSGAGHASYLGTAILYLGLTLFYIVVLYFSIVYSRRAMRVSKKYTAFQISNVDKSNAWRK